MGPIRCAMNDLIEKQVRVVSVRERLGRGGGVGGAGGAGCHGRREWGRCRDGGMR